MPSTRAYSTFFFFFWFNHARIQPIRLWRHTILSSSCLLGLDGNTPAPSADQSAHCESTKEIKRAKTRVARTKESTHFEKTERNHRREPNTKTTPLAPPRRPSPPPPLLPRCPNSPPPVELSFRHGCFARSLGPPGCTSHLLVGRLRAISAPPLRRLLDPRSHHGLLVVAVLEQVVSRLASTTGRTTSSSRLVCCPYSLGTHP